MTARTHDMFAFASLITVAALYPPNKVTVITLAAGLIGNIVGALIPDIDQASNRLWSLLPAGNFLGRILRNLLLGHRTISHSILGTFLFYEFLLFILPKLFNPNYVNVNIVLVAIMIGYISHLIADSLTKEGIPLFFPFNFKIGIPPIKFLRITTGSFAENILFFPAVIIYIFWFTFNHQKEILAILNMIKT